MKLDNIKMDNGWMLIKPILQEKSKGGIFMPVTATERFRKGAVVSCPTDSSRMPGDLVVYDGYSAHLDTVEINQGDKLIKVEMIKSDQIIMKYGTDEKLVGA